MALSIYTRPDDDELIEAVKIKAIKEKTSLSEVTLELLQLWVNGTIKLENRKGASK